MATCELMLPVFLSFLCPLMHASGYLTVFIANLVGSASIILPLPSFALVFFMAGLGFDPWLLALAASLGAAIGEVTGYLLGAGGRRVAEVHDRRKVWLGMFRTNWLEKAQRWSERRGFFAVIVLFAATPLPHDVAGILAGAIGYDIKKFIGATFIGKMVMFSLLAWAGLFGIEWVLELMNPAG